MTVRSPLPSLQSIRVLEAAARHKSFSAAGEELGLSHSAISHQIRGLEAWTEYRLFDRRGRQMEPTPEALRLVARTRQALASLHEAFNEPKARAPERLRLSTTTAFARYWLLPRIIADPEAWAGRIRLLQSGPDLSSVSSGEADVAIRYGPGGWADVQSVRLGPERAFPVASPSLAERIAGSDGDWWATAPLIAQTFVPWSAWLDMAGFGSRPVPAPLIELSDTGLAIEAACAGLGVILGRKRLCRQLIAEGRLTALSDIGVDDGYAYHLVWRPQRSIQRPVEALVERLMQEFSREDV